MRKLGIIVVCSSVAIGAFWSGIIVKTETLPPVVITDEAATPVPGAKLRLTAVGPFKVILSQDQAPEFWFGNIGCDSIAWMPGADEFFSIDAGGYYALKATLSIAQPDAGSMFAGTCYVNQTADPEPPHAITTDDGDEYDILKGAER